MTSSIFIPAPSPQLELSRGRARVLSSKLARKLLWRGWLVEREGPIVTVHGRGPPSTEDVFAILLMGAHRRLIGIMDIQAPTPGTGVGTALVDALVEVARSMRYEGLAFMDASDGVQEGGGFWRAYAKKRELLLLTGDRFGITETRLLVGAMEKPA